MYKKAVSLATVLMFVSTPGLSADVVTTKNVGMELARDLASEAVLVCRKSGYQVAAVVVDRHANVRAVLRDDLAARFSIEIAERKANAAVMGGVSSGDFRKNRGDIRPELNHIQGIIMLEGGLLIESSGTRIGAIGVSGAPGGDKDAACAAEALKKLDDRLQFAE